MKKLAILFSITMLVTSSSLKAQEDDMYFTPKKDKKVAKTEKTTRKVEVVLETEEPSNVYTSRVTATVPVSEVRDVDEYNRRGKKPSSFSSDTVSTESQIAEGADTQTYRLSAQSLYDLGYSEGYEEGYSDGNDMDFYYGLRLARFHGYHHYEPWYWNRISFIYDPWHWDPWYWDPWYRPYYYGGWYSVGWGVGYCGTYWNPYWPGYHHGYYPGYYPHHHHGVGHHAYGPRVSTSRNHDYGRTRIVDRRGSSAHTWRYDSSTNRNITGTRTSQRATDRATRMNQRNTDRNKRVTDRSTNGTTNRSSNRVTNRSSSRTSERTVNRSTTTDRSQRSGTSNMNGSSNRSTNRSSTSSRMGGSSTSRGGGFGSPSGGSRHGGGRGR